MEQALNIERYRIEDLLLDTGVQEITRDGIAIPLPRLSFDLLLVLARHAPNLVTSEEIESEVWAGLVVSPATIAKRVGLLREAIGDDPENPKYITVVRGRGYRLVVPVSRVGSEMKYGADVTGGTAGIRKIGRPGLLAIIVLVVFVTLAAFLALQLNTDTKAGSTSTGIQSIDESVSEHAISSRNIPDLSIAVGKCPLPG